MAVKNSIVYAILRPIVELGARIFMRQLSIRGMEHFPKDKPVLLISNHQNAMLDPVLLCVLLPRQLHWLTRSDVFKKGFVERFLHQLNMMPVYRERDGVDDLRSKNQMIFEECYRRLSGGAVIAMFPEGTHRGRKQLIPFKKGLARLVFGAHQADVKDLHILPIGLDYSGFYDYHPELVMRVGKPIAVNQYVTNGESAQEMNRLLADTRSALSSLMIDVQKDECYDAIIGLRELVMTAAPAKGFGNAFDYYLSFSKRFEENADAHIIQIATEYLEISSRFKIDDLEANTSSGKQNMRLIGLGIFLPIYLIGRTVYAPLERRIERFIKKAIKDLLFKNSLRLALYTFLAPLYTVLLCIIPALILDWSFITTICIIAILMIFGRLAIFWLRMYHRWRKGNRWLKWMKTASAERKQWGEKRSLLMNYIKELMEGNISNV